MIQDPAYARMITLILAVFAGVLFFIISRRLKIPAIVLLLAGGVLLGPEFIGLVQPASLNELLRLIVSFSVAIILFEGGLTLRPEGFNKAPEAIKRLLSLGVLVTWFGTAFFIWLLFSYSIAFSLLAGSLIIVTGPTVIAPLLQRINVKEKLHSVLHWEGVLIDPIGVFIAILCFEWLNSQATALDHVMQFGLRVLLGLVLGYAGGKLVSYSLKKHWIAEDQINIFVFAVAIFLYGISEFFMHEAGILTVVIAGLVIGHDQPPGLKDIQKFKQELTEISISLVFILLAATLKLEIFIEYGWNLILLLAAIIFVIRPVSIFLCTWGTKTTFREKLFLSWIAPRGVVAGSMASLFGLQMVSKGVYQGAFLEAFTFSVIGSTIILQGFSAGWVAKILGVEAPEKKDWLIVGAHLFATQVGSFIKQTTQGRCIYVDTNSDAVEKMKVKGHLVIQGNALNPDVVPVNLRSRIGYVLALTDNRDLNQLICEKWSEWILPDHLYRWTSQHDEVEQFIGGTGIPIWSELPKPSKTSFDIRNRDILIHQRPVDHEDQEREKKMFRLLSFSKEKLFFEDTKEPQTGDLSLFLQRITRHLSLFISQNELFRFKVTGYDDLLQQAVNKLCEINTEIECEGLIETFLERELNFPTMLSHGILAPHIHHPGLKHPACLIAEVNAVPESEDVTVTSSRLMFLLISPENDPDGHLIMLAEIAKIATIPGLIDTILNADAMPVIMQQIRSVETGGNG
jgi:NhaP-type Na+/H+ or K+/H+ antiporter/mannitol/fructose-specific phosphotransferase system IIA component (Ntr-type)